MNAVSATEGAVGHRAVHRPVLCREAVGYLAASAAQGDFVDATFGQGGHSRELLRRLNADARLLALDRDRQAFKAAQALAEQDGRVLPRHGQFGEVATILSAAGMVEVQGALMDLGLSSAQLDDPQRGFSFRADGPLDMRMDTCRGTTAGAWLNQAPAAEIAKVLRDYGEERYAGRISRAICAARPLSTTRQLAQAVAAGQPRPSRGKHGATRVFQAVRIFVNDELKELQAGLQGLFDALAVGGRLVVIAFHSLEDRIVKRFFRACSSPPPVPRHVPVRAGEQPVPARLVAGPVRPSAAEVRANVRARSAVLRVLERIA